MDNLAHLSATSRNWKADQVFWRWNPGLPYLIDVQRTRPS
jgi:hypothetical protein